MSRVKGKLNDSDDEGQSEEAEQVYDPQSAVPPIPVMPWWFTRECEEQMKLASENPIPTSNYLAVPQVVPQPQPTQISQGFVCRTPEQVRELLRQQLEYYFSRCAIKVAILTSNLEN